MGFQSMEQSDHQQPRAGYTDESTPLHSNYPANRIRRKTTANTHAWKAWIAVGLAVSGALCLVIWGVVSNVVPPKQVPIEPTPPKHEVVFRPYCQTYGKTTAKLIQTSLSSPSHQWSEQPCYSVDPEHGLFGRMKQAVVDEYQVPDAVLQVDFESGLNRTILGFGGAFTEAAALNYNSLSQIGKDRVMELLFGESGLGYRYEPTLS